MIGVEIAAFSFASLVMTFSNRFLDSAALRSELHIRITYIALRLADSAYQKKENTKIHLKNSGNIRDNRL